MKGRDAKGVDVGFEGDSVDLEGQRLRVKYVLNTGRSEKGLDVVSLLFSGLPTGPSAVAAASLPPPANEQCRRPR